MARSSNRAARRYKSKGHEYARSGAGTRFNLVCLGKTSLDTRDGSVVLALMPMIRLSKTIYAVRRPMSGLVRTCDSWPGHVALTGNAMVADSA